MGSLKEKGLGYLQELQLGAMEYQAVRRVPTKIEPLKRFGEEARARDIVLSLHGPYAINLASTDDEIARMSAERLYWAIKAAEAMGARHVTFHPGYYTRRGKEEALRIAISALSDLKERLKQEGIKVELGPETAGRPSQLGSLDEVLRMAEDVEGVRPTIDFAHIHARYGGILRKKGDYGRVLDEIESRTGGLDGLVVHFTEVEMTKKGIGEMRHRQLGSGYGPDFRLLAEEIAERGVKWLLISESPLLEQDSLRMKRIYGSALSQVVDSGRLK